MLIQGLYDFFPRTEDTSKTLPFEKNDILMFLEVYPRDSNWLKATDRKGRIGYIPRNYIRMCDEVSRDVLLDFLLEAVLTARRDKLTSVETLEALKDHIVRIEYREFQTRLLRQAMKNMKEEAQVEIEDGSTYTCDQSERSKVIKGRTAYESASGTSIVSKKSNMTHVSTNTVPVKHANSVHNTPTGHPSKSCPQQCPKSITNFSTRPSNNPILKNQIENRFASGDKIGPVYSKTAQKVNSQISNSNKASSRVNIPNSSQRNVLSLSQYTSNTNSNILNGNEIKMAARLIKTVQESGNLDMHQSEVVVHRVLHHVQEHLTPGMAEKVGCILRILEKSPSSVSLHLETEPSKKVKEIIQYITTMDSQNQNLVPSTEEEQLILTKLDKLCEELMNLEQKMLKHLIQADHYQSIHDLVLVYQTETRTLIKAKLLQIFSMIATLDSGARSVLLSSILPIELAREMYLNEKNPLDLSKLANTLTSLLSSGESMPETHYSMLGSKFTSFILNYLEDLKEDELAKSDLMNLLLAYNLQFKEKDGNLIIKQLAGLQPRYFMECLMNLFDSEVDPVSSGSPSNDLEVHSVFKMLKDMFSSKMTAEHFHKADMKWLSDLIYKNLSELGPGDKRRGEYLKLLWLVMRNRQLEYRLGNIMDVLVGILLEEDILSIEDQRVVKGINKEFPRVFRKNVGGYLASASNNNTAF